MSSNRGMSRSVSSSSTTPRTYAGQSAADRDAERRAAFLEAGLELIGTQGYRAATVRGLCREAGYTDRYFYALFGNTEGLLAAVYSELVERLKHSMRTAIEAAPEDDEARVDAGLTTYVRFMRDERNARIMMGEILGVSDDITALYLQTVVEFADLLLASAPGIGDQSPGEEARLFGQSLIGAVIYAAGAWAMSGYRQPEAQVIGCCRSILLGALQRYQADHSG